MFSLLVAGTFPLFDSEDMFFCLGMVFRMESENVGRSGVGRWNFALRRDGKLFLYRFVASFLYLFDII